MFNNCMNQHAFAGKKSTGYKYETNLRRRLIYEGNVNFSSSSINQNEI